MKYKIAVFDLDGTLTNNKKELTDRTRNALLSLQQQGVKVVLASGRPTYGIQPLAEQLQMANYGGYILAYNGGVIIDCASQQVVYSQMLPEQILPQLYDESKEAGCVILSYRGAQILTESPEDQYVEYEAMLNKMEAQGVESFVESFRCPVPKCLAVGDPAQAAHLEQRLVELFGEQMSIYRSEPFFVELVPLGIDKAKSLARLAEIEGVTSDDMISFGDGFNDLSMIEYAGCGVAMANAQPLVKERADVVALSNEQEGVADYIERQLLAK